MNSLPRAGLRCITPAFALVFSVSSPAFAQGTLILYATRGPGLTQPLFDSWTKTNGVRVGTVYIKDGTLEYVRAEGKNSPADLLMIVDAGNLIGLVEAGVTQSVESEALRTATPANLHGADNQWFALSMRVHMLYTEKLLPIDNWHYEQPASPEYKGKVYIRPEQHLYNTALIAVMIAHHGGAKTEEWLRGVKASLARKATGGDRDVVHDILGGICDIGLANSYHTGHIKNAKEDSDARQWDDAIKVVKPTLENDGTHADIGGAIVARYALNKADAAKLMEYLIFAPVQQQYVKMNFEYPTLKGVTLDPVISTTIDEVDVDKAPLTEIAKYRKQASLPIDKVRFDQ